MIRSAWPILVCLVACAAIAGGQNGAAPKGEAAGALSASRPSGGDDSGSRLLETPPRIIQPAWSKDGNKPSAHTQPFQVVDIRARILRYPAAMMKLDQDVFMVRYIGKPGRTPAPQCLLPCRLLEQIEPLLPATQESEDQPVISPRLKISGETTWYRKRSFLLLNEVIVDSGEGAGDSTPGASTLPAASDPAPISRASVEPNALAVAGGEPGPKLLTELAGDGNRPPVPGAMGASPAAPSGTAPAASAPATRAASSTAPSGADPSDIFNRLARERPGKSLGSGVPVPQTQAAVKSVAPATSQPALTATHGAMVVDRIVQIYAEDKGTWWAIHFLGDNTLREPPIRLLPCAMLEEAENRIAASATHLKFRVSGEMTDYKGRKYLLLRKLMIEPDLGQL